MNIFSGSDIAVMVAASVPVVGTTALAFIERKKSQINKALLVEANERILDAINEANQAKAEMKSLNIGLDFAGFVKHLTNLSHKVRKLQLRTNVDRFLLLRAWNGQCEYKWTSAFMQIRSGNEPVEYTHLELDHDYTTRLKEVQFNGWAYYIVADLPPCSVKDIYEAEGVTAALWILLHIQTHENGTASFTYVSYATHNPDGLTRNEIIDCRINADSIKGAISAFYN